MKINPLDAHDRYSFFTQQEFDIGSCCQDLINKRPFGDIPFYAYVHFRTEDGSTDQRCIWQPRLTKPKAGPNTMLFKLYPGSDIVKIIWMIPKPELWKSFQKGLMTENKVIAESIHKFRTDPQALEAKEDDDLSDEQIDKVYEALAMDAKIKRKK